MNHQCLRRAPNSTSARFTPRVATLALIAVWGWIGISTMAATGEPNRGTPPEGRDRNNWYWNSPVNIHWDNHGNPLGKDLSVDEIARLFEGIKVDMIQVSARSGYTTYPSRLGVPNPKLEGFDTLATWGEVTRRLGTRLWIYINVIDEPQLIAEHSRWQRVDAKGNRTKVCNRPSADGSGYLEQMMIPMVREIIERYRPEGFWFDGDWQIPPVCYCPNCTAAWKTLTGKDEPPRETKDSDWPRWARLEHERLDAYKQKLAEAIHQADPQCCYVSNWSWAISQRDPRTAPTFADVLSGDVGAGTSQNALYACRFACLMLAAQEHTPHDVMSAIYPKKIRTLPRMLQEGGLVMSSGSSWFLWVNQLAPEQFAHLRQCCQLVDARREALGRTHSLNPVAVLLSETAWQQGLTNPEPAYFDSNAPRNLAFALQDAGYGVDVVNEQALGEQLAHWRIIVVANQREVRPETLGLLKRFVEAGGTLIVTDGALRSQGEELPDVAGLLGLVRQPWTRPSKARLAVRGRTVPVGVGWKVEPRGATILERLAGAGEPALTVNTLGKGRVAYLSLAGAPNPDEDGVALWLMEKLGLGPMVAVSGNSSERHLLFSLRRRSEQQLVLHVSDITTHVGGKRIEPNSSHEIDAMPAIPEVSLQLPLPAKPKSAKAAPSSARLDWQYEDGLLRLTLHNVQTHAAVILDTPSPEAIGLLPPALHALPRTYDRSPLILVEDFEGTPVGKFPAHPIWSANADAKTSIRVAIDPTSAGNRVLEFVDAPDARAAFVPYVVIQPKRLDRGRAKFACDLFLEPGAKVGVELRDETAGTSATGPSVRIAENGRVRAAGKDLAAAPVGQWFRLELEFSLGFDSPSYGLTIVRPDKPAERFAGLAYSSRSFSSCSWLGITSDAAAKTRFYIDNVRLERLP